MGIEELIVKISKTISDPYDRQARLWPALLALFPVLATLSMLYVPAFSVLSNVVLLAVSCGGLYLLTDISRESGKRLEERLYVRWGGKPTTQLLRHRDKTIDGVTKQRYHLFLSGMIKVPFPDRPQEAVDPDSADDVYQSATRWLLNKTFGDTKNYPLQFKENVAYGFRRNALGVKPIGLGMCFVSIGLIIVNQGIVTFANGVNFDMQAMSRLTENGVISLSASFVMLSLWCFYITASTVRTAAFTFAETLFRACDKLAKK